MREEEDKNAHIDTHSIDKCDRHKNMRFQFSSASIQPFRVICGGYLLGLLILWHSKRTNGYLHVIINSHRLFRGTKTQYSDIDVFEQVYVYIFIVVVIVWWTQNHLHLEKRQSKVETKLFVYQKNRNIYILFRWAPFHFPHFKKFRSFHSFRSFRSSDQHKW